MKKISYKVLTAEINHGTEEEPNIEQVVTPMVICCHTQAQYDNNYPIAEKEAIPGTIDSSGEFDPEPEPVETTDDVLNALLGVTV